MTLEMTQRTSACQNITLVPVLNKERTKIVDAQIWPSLILFHECCGNLYTRYSYTYD